MSTTAQALPARERILATAYELFSRRGIRAVGVDEIIAASEVAKGSLYRHFPAKDNLVAAFLDRREHLWTLQFLAAESAARTDNPAGQLLAIFDVFDDWFARADFEGCSFINVLLEMGPAHPLGRAAIGHLAAIRAVVAERATAAGLTEVEEFTHGWHLLMKGAIIAAAEGDTHAARRGKQLGRLLLAAHQPKLVS